MQVRQQALNKLDLDIRLFIRKISEFQPFGFDFCHLFHKIKIFHRYFKQWKLKKNNEKLTLWASQIIVYYGQWTVLYYDYFANESDDEGKPQFWHFVAG